MNNDVKNTVAETEVDATDNVPEISNKKSKGKINIRMIIALVVAVVVLCIVSFNVFPIGEFLDFDKGEGEAVTVEIPQGASADSIADILIDKGVVESKFAFKLKLKFHEKGDQLKYGKYNLDTSMTLSEVIEELARGYHEGILITIPEGYSAEMIASLCEEKGICTKEEFLYALTNGDFNYDFLKNVPTNPHIRYRLQGFLFPDTYEYNENTTAEDMINSMLKAYERNVNIPSDRNLNYFEILTLASVIEREAKMDNERAKISGVFMNRLEIDMPLQACATVIYAKSEGRYDMDTVLYSDLEVESPYNTYKNPGLPIGPICNPGKAAIQAAINPERHSYLFYHTDERKKDGSHIFTESYQEHNLTQR